MLTGIGGLLDRLAKSLGRSGPPPPDPAERQRIAEAAASIPYERIEVPGRDALAAADQLRGSGRGWPVVVGDDTKLLRLASHLSYGSRYKSQSINKILRAAAKIGHPDDLLARLAVTKAAALQRHDGFDPRPEPRLGVWPPDESAHQYSMILHDIFKGKPIAVAHILLIPTDEGAAVPAYLGWGGWRSCPPPEYHVAALRAWKSRYGAELFALSDNYMELRVATRPKSREEALVLAREQYAYCPTIVAESVNTLSHLGAMRKASDWWFFSWERD